MPEPTQVTLLLRELAEGGMGEGSAADRLFPLIYEDLRELAERQLRSERREHTLQATALVNEAYIRLVGMEGVALSDRQHFLAIAAKAMRCVLIDHARGKNRQKRGGGRERILLDDVVAGAAGRGVELLALEDALGKLERTSPDRVKLVELRFFGGLNLEESAALLGISLATAKREWATTKVWLYRELSEDTPPRG